MKFICPHCKKETEDTVGGTLVDGFILECSECFDTTVVRFEAAQQRVQADLRPKPCAICGSTKSSYDGPECPVCGASR